VGKRKAVKETEAAGGGAVLTGHGFHHRLPVAATKARGCLWPARVVCFPNTTFWCIFWSADFACVWSFWASFAIFFDPIGLNKNIF